MGKRNQKQRRSKYMQIMKYILLLALVVNLGSSKVLGQTVIPFKYTSEDDNKLIKENDSLRYYAATGDTLNLVAINEETMHYKLVNRKDKKRTVAEGDIVGEGDKYLQTGRWVQYHSNGKPAIAGSFYRGKPVGRWEEYYPDGKVKLSYHYAIITDKDGMSTCMSGEYTEYYNDGSVKVSGYYAADRNKKTETTTVEDPVSSSTVTKTVSKSVYTPRKAGSWEYYNDSGELEKKEDL
jgi:antitoxin component YwqK of YwqJK toxin-antitoxin module